MRNLNVNFGLFTDTASLLFMTLMSGFSACKHSLNLFWCSCFHSDGPLPLLRRYVREAFAIRVMVDLMTVYNEFAVFVHIGVHVTPWHVVCCTEREVRLILHWWILEGRHVRALVSHRSQIFRGQIGLRGQLFKGQDSLGSLGVALARGVFRDQVNMRWIFNHY